LKSSNEILITFFSTHQVLRAEKLLKGKVPRLDLIPVPREISSECGFCLLLGEPVPADFRLPDGLVKEHIYRVVCHDQGGKTYEYED